MTYLSCCLLDWFLSPFCHQGSWQWWDLPGTCLSSPRAVFNSPSVQCVVDKLNVLLLFFSQHIVWCLYELNFYYLSFTLTLALVNSWSLVPFTSIAVGLSKFSCIQYPKITYMARACGRLNYWPFLGTNLIKNIPGLNSWALQCICASCPYRPLLPHLLFLS